VTVDPDTSPATSPHNPPESVTAPLFVWLMIQLAALALAAARVPLSANFARPAERLATHEMVIVQFVGAALLCPFLLRGPMACLALCLTAGPMLLLAGILSATPIATSLYLWAGCVLWLTALWMWRAATSQRMHAPLVAIATLLSAGALLLCYLRAEFGPAGAGGVELHRALPLPPLLLALSETRVGIAPLLPTAVIFGISLAFFAVRRRACARSASRVARRNI
jgi:hypothetical protein